MKTILLASGKAITFCFFLLAISVTSLAQTPSNDVIFQNATLVNGQKTYVQLNWTGNKDVAYFLIEKSVDNKNYKQCALVFTGEDASVSEFNFRDRSIDIEATTVYYRIGVVNASKEVVYLPVKTISKEKSNNTVALLDGRRP